MRLVELSCLISVAVLLLSLATTETSFLFQRLIQRFNAILLHDSFVKEGEKDHSSLNFPLHSIIIFFLGNRVTGIK